MLLRLLFLSLFFSSSLVAQEAGHRITIEIDGYDQDILTLGYYFLDNQYIIDTAYRSESGSYVFQNDSDRLPQGIYLVVLSPDNSYFQLVVGDDEDQEFTMKTRKAALNEMEVTGSEENELFYQYLGYLNEMQQQSGSVRTQLADTTLAPALAAQARDQMQSFDQEVKAYQQKIISEHPDAFVTAIIKANQAAIPPDFAEETDEEARRTKQWRWLQAHYFDGLNLKDERLLRTPFLFERIDYYVNTLQLRHPDTLAQAIDFVLDQFDPLSDAYKFYTVHFTNNAASSNIVGMDALYVHMVDKYYRDGKAFWADEEQLTKMVETADRLRPLLIGRQAPDMDMVTREGEDIQLYDVDSEYTVLYFWRYDCPACKKSTPHMKEFYNKWKDKGVTIFSVCTKGVEDLGKCWEYVDEHGIGDWVQAADPYQRYYKNYDIKSTPAIFLLDKDKRIVSKRISAEQLDEVLTNLTSEKAGGAPGR